MSITIEDSAGLLQEEKRALLAPLLEERARTPSTEKALTAIEPVARGGETELPLSFAQQRLWFLDQ